MPISTWFGGCRLRAHRRADEAEHDQDPAEAGDGEEQRRNEGEAPDQEHDLDGA